MNTTPFYHTINDQRLAGIIVRSDANSHQLPRCVYIHGGGPTSYKERIYDLAPSCVGKNINMLSFDFRGHGESPGILSEGSLAERHAQASGMMQQYAAPHNLILVGASMGGYVAIKLLEQFRVDTLILICPALYDAQAYDASFNRGFSDIIRAPESWRNTDALPILEQFTGSLLVVMGSEDELIPPGVIELIMQHTPRARKKELYVIPQCHHKIHTWLEDHPAELRQLQKKVSEYI